MAGEYKKLYPPVIEGTLPAFSGTELSVPFSMNRAVSDTEVYGFIIKVKNVYNNITVGEFKYTVDAAEGVPAAAVFNISEAKDNFHVGEYYKIQMAYLWKNSSDVHNDKYVGYYSTVGVIKYTTKPTVTIANMNENDANAYYYNYMGVYSQEGKDTTERVYRYRFDLLDNYYNLVDTSDWQLHNAAQDNVIYESNNTYQFKTELESNRTYYINYSIETTNKMIVSSPNYRIVQNLSINPDIAAHLVPVMNKDNGYIDLKLQGEINSTTKIEEAVTGTFKVVRASSLDNFTTWDEVMKFSLYGQQPSRDLWKDFTVQQGVTYRYALQQYNNQLLTSNRIESVDIVADFEDMFLYDGERQLKIRFNPKVTSFKNTLLETKTDTIGSKYPFIFRNGNVKYKEFPISGLISYHADEEKLFMNYSLETVDTNLTSENIATERDFKLEVLEWLTNGQPKLFRSPSEGNYVVRLMNTSLAPTDAVGRMLHTFSATAYEIDDCNYQTLDKYGFIQLAEQPMQQIRWESIVLNEERQDENYNLLNYTAIGLDIQGATPGELIYIDDGIDRGDSTMYTMMPEGRTTGYIASIGPTGNYKIDIDNDIKITFVGVVSIYKRNNDYQRLVIHPGNLVYAYYSRLMDTFDLISSITTEEVTMQQFIGTQKGLATQTDIIPLINDIKNEIQSFTYLKFYRKNEVSKKIYGVRKEAKSNFYNYYQSLEDISNNIKMIDLDDLTVYDVYEAIETENEEGEVIFKENGFLYYLYGNDKFNTIADKRLDYTIQIDYNTISLEDIPQYITTNLNKIKSLRIGSGVVAECSYIKQIKNYTIESQDEELKNNSYQQYYNNLVQIIYNEQQEYDDSALIKYVDDCDIAVNSYYTHYQSYINLLEEKIKEKEAVQGDEV